MKRYAYAWITLGFFLVTIALHWLFGWYAYVDEAIEHHQNPQFSQYLTEMSRDTFDTSAPKVLPVPSAQMTMFFIRHAAERLRTATPAAASVAIIAGMTAAQNTSRIGVFCVSSRPPTTGPTIDPIRPMPSAQPTPVDRMRVG